MCNRMQTIVRMHVNERVDPRCILLQKTIDSTTKDPKQTGESRHLIGCNSFSESRSLTKEATCAKLLMIPSFETWYASGQEFNDQVILQHLTAVLFVSFKVS